MKLFSIYIYIFSSLVMLSGAQTNESPQVNASSLQADKQSPEERIKFLSDVAQAYFRESDYASAISAYERILEIDPAHEEARFILSHVYINGKQHKKAEELLLELIEEFPENFQLHNNLAWLYATSENPSIRSGKRAIEIAHLAMVLNPSDYHVWSTLSEAYYISGDYDKAYRAIQQMASLATRYSKDLSEESINNYNEQILKCKRAMETAESMKSNDKE